MKNRNAESQSIVFRTWKEVSPDLGVADAILSQSLLLFMMIILLAMSFGILNTMLMAVLERTRELGMLMAIGMNKKKIFIKVYLNSLLRFKKRENLEIYFLSDFRKKLSKFRTITFFFEFIDLSLF